MVLNKFSWKDFLKNYFIMLLLCLTPLLFGVGTFFLQFPKPQVIFSAALIALGIYFFFVFSYLVKNTHEIRVTDGEIHYKSWGDVILRRSMVRKINISKIRNMDLKSKVSLEYINQNQPIITTVNVYLSNHVKIPFVFVGRGFEGCRSFHETLSKLGVSYR